jgi:hypothetical protein
MRANSWTIRFNRDCAEAGTVPGDRQPRAAQRQRGLREGRFVTLDYALFFDKLFKGKTAAASVPAQPAPGRIRQPLRAGRSAPPRPGISHARSRFMTRRSRRARPAPSLTTSAPTPSRTSGGSRRPSPATTGPSSLNPTMPMRSAIAASSNKNSAYCHRLSRVSTGRSPWSPPTPWRTTTARWCCKTAPGGKRQQPATIRRSLSIRSSRTPNTIGR